VPKPLWVGKVSVPPSENEPSAFGVVDWVTLSVAWPLSALGRRPSRVPGVGAIQRGDLSRNDGAGHASLAKIPSPCKRCPWRNGVYAGYVQKLQGDKSGVGGSTINHWRQSCQLKFSVADGMPRKCDACKSPGGLRTIDLEFAGRERWRAVETNWSTGLPSWLLDQIGSRKLWNRGCLQHSRRVRLREEAVQNGARVS